VWRYRNHHKPFSLRAQPGLGLLPMIAICATCQGAACGARCAQLTENVCYHRLKMLRILIGFVIGGSLGFLLCEGFLFIVHESQRPNHPYVPNWDGASVKALFVGVTVGGLAGLWSRLRSKK
jgi:hypothetical protein